MPFYYDNHQADKDIGEIEKLEKTVKRTLGLCKTLFCVCLCKLYLRIIVCDRKSDF